MHVAVNGTELWFDVEGTALIPDGTVMRERPVVLVLHGGPGFDHAYLRPFLTPLAESAQLIYLDHRGQGRSAAVPVETCTVEQMADDAVGFCRTLGLEQPTILGHSFGGFVALVLALRHPGVASSLVLVDTAAAWADQAGALDLLETRHGPTVRAVAARLIDGDTSAEALTEFTRLVFPTYVGDPACVAPIMEAIGRSRFVPEVSTFFSEHLADAYDVRARLGEIGMPTLVAVGGFDWRVPPSASETIAAGIPGAQLWIVPGAGHFPFAEQPAAFADRVARFLARSTG